MTASKNIINKWFKTNDLPYDAKYSKVADPF